MSERSLEARLYDALVRNTDGGGVRLKGMSPSEFAQKLRVALTLSARSGFALGVRMARETTPLVSSPEEWAEREIPLPTCTVRKRREETDPDGDRVMYSWDVAEDVEDGSDLGLVVHGGKHPFPTPKRIALWYDLMQRPWSEESVPVDPREILP